jgi:hypothetical protein
MSSGSSSTHRWIAAFTVSELEALTYLSEVLQIMIGLGEKKSTS